MAKFSLPPPDIQVTDPASGRFTADYYEKFKEIERLALPDLANAAAKTVATLPAAGHAGARNFVTDANATTFASIVAGGGANKVPVYDDGANWRIG